METQGKAKAVNSIEKELIKKKRVNVISIGFAIDSPTNSPHRTSTRPRAYAFRFSFSHLSLSSQHSFAMTILSFSFSFSTPYSNFTHILWMTERKLKLVCMVSCESAWIEIFPRVIFTPTHHFICWLN